ncbi:FadR/GntR family transcriptional regulator [Virgibacillus sediminis]|uniref:FadR/GntR family transcriptional regulator n=1 Tax=Virgibacillus sediminis TaxID=202260 RepID=A0ABV7A4X0_9BACI
MGSRSREVESQIGRRIVSGAIQPGEKLPKVEELSEQYGVSRTVVREALQGLSSKNIIRANQRSGTIVLPSNQWQWWDLDVITWLSDYQGRDGEFYLDMTDVRLGIEPIAAQLAARNATEEDKEEITERFKDLENALGDMKKWAKADYEFHFRIIEASHNTLMISLLKLLHNGLVISREKSLSTLRENPDLQQGEPDSEIIKRHKDLYKAVINGDEEQAKSVMENMILRVKELFEKTLLQNTQIK